MTGNAGPTGVQTDSASDEWCTPAWLCEALGYYDLDPCSNDRSHVLARKSLKLSRGEDGLDERDHDWADLANAAGRRSRIFVNPPYSNVMPWAVRAAQAAEVWECRVDVLVKLDPTTKWWARLVTVDVPVGVWVFRKRLKFERPDKPPLTANFPSALVCLNSRIPDSFREHVWHMGNGH